jgi:hypothetical protein
MSYSISTKSTNSTTKEILLVLANTWCNCFFANKPTGDLKVELNEDFYLETNDGYKISGIYYLSKKDDKIDGIIELNKKMANPKGADNNGKISENSENNIISSSSSGKDLWKISFKHSTTDKYIIYVDKYIIYVDK